MPEPLWLYLMALLYFPNVTTCSAIADAFASVSPDRLTRMLQGPWSGHPRLQAGRGLALPRRAPADRSWCTSTGLAPGCSRAVLPATLWHNSMRIFYVSLH